MGLPYGEIFMILSSTVFDWCARVTDGRTDGRAIAYCALSIYTMLSRAKNGLSVIETKHEVNSWVSNMRLNEHKLSASGCWTRSVPSLRRSAATDETRTSPAEAEHRCRTLPLTGDDTPTAWPEAGSSDHIGWQRAHHDEPRAPKQNITKQSSPSLVCKLVLHIKNEITTACLSGYSRWNMPRLTPPPWCNTVHH